MKWFGDRWKAPVCETEPQVSVPEGQCCYQCNKPIEPTHRGLVLPFHGNPGAPPELYVHLFCFAQSVGLKVGN